MQSHFAREAVYLEYQIRKSKLNGPYISVRCGNHGSVLFTNLPGKKQNTIYVPVKLSLVQLPVINTLEDKGKHESTGV